MQKEYKIGDEVELTLISGPKIKGRLKYLNDIIGVIKFKEIDKDFMPEDFKERLEITKDNLILYE